MVRKLRALGLAVGALFAMSALVASAAQAETPAQFNATSYPSILTVEAKATQTFTAGTLPAITCEKVSGEATVSEETSTITGVNVEYTECEADLFGGTAATVNFNGCDYVFHAGTMEGTSTSTGSADLVCPEGKEVVINASGLCTVRIPGQTELGPITFHNEPAGEGTPEHWVRMSPNVSGIASSHSGFCGSGSDAVGTYTGDVAVKGFEDVEDEEGSPVGVEVTG